MTADEWKKVEEALSGYMGIVDLNVEGTPIQFRRGLVAKNRLGIVTFVCGKWEGKWMMPDNKNEHPEKRYLRPVWRFSWKREARKMLKKMSKRQLKRMGYDPDEKYLAYSLIWSSAATIRRHYEKTFKNIKLVEINGEAV
jgi:hypothetical protein